MRARLVIGLCCLLVYNANRRAISAGDTYPARYLPFAIVQYHTVLLDPIAAVTAQGRGGAAFWMVPLPSGHVISLYPVVVPLLVAPLYVPAVAYVHRQGWSDAAVDRVARIMEKLAASLIASLSAALLYVLLRRRADARTALLLTIAFAFGTTTWMISSQALWQHGLAQLLVIGALLFVTRDCTAPRALAAGLLCGLIAANRPPDAILSAALLAYGVFWARRRAVLLVAGAALPVALTLVYNVGIAGNIAGGYGLHGTAEFLQHDLLSGIGGLLFSPTRGLFVFSPFLLFLALAWKQKPRDRGERWLTIAMSVAIALQILLYAKTDWRTGLSWGPRYLTDLLPFLMWMLVPVVATLRGRARAAFVAAVGVAILIEAIGAFWYTSSTDSAIFSSDNAAWRWRNAPFIASLRHGPEPPDLFTNIRGTFDTVEDLLGATAVITSGEEAAATGWALAGDATPFQVAITIDGKQMTSTRTFVDRADVRKTLGVATAAGWRVPFDTTALTPGTHRLTALVWPFERGESRYLAERTLTVRAPGVDADLEAGFKKAVARLRRDQQPPGFWLTAYTSAMQFRDPHPEMNTFLTALLVELLEPVAPLADNVQRARRHLTEQIESGGLVRFHGLPNGPGIGTLGCAITPDTDDTALVWRLAPAPDRERLTAALATIDRYRTSDGLYRTWLAPRDEYQCLDPGSDPNPADIAIQMHLLLLLSDVRPPAARALCAALRPVVAEDRVWVYYRKAPLIAMLRLPDLQRAGCELQLPESRMRTDVPRQEVWVSAVRMLTGGDAAGRREVLRKLAKNDFALLRTNPPLLYHNDLTATVSRYYWSEDVGYALWLRLYHQDEHDRSPDSGR